MIGNPYCGYTRTGIVVIDVGCDGLYACGGNEWTDVEDMMRTLKGSGYEGSFVFEMKVKRGGSYEYVLLYTPIPLHSELFLCKIAMNGRRSTILKGSQACRRGEREDNAGLAPPHPSPSSMNESFPGGGKPMP